MKGNSAVDRGGAVFLNSIIGNPTVVAVRIMGCVLYDNSADRGGAIFLGGTQFTSGKALVSNCTIAYNEALSSGGGIRAVTTSQFPALSRVQNCVIWANRAPLGANLSGRHLVAFSCIGEAGYTTGGNIDQDPRFVDPVNRNLRLWSGSPANDAGAGGLIVSDWTDVDYDSNFNETIEIDIDGRRRVHDDPGAVNRGTIPVDMGAFEY